MLFTDCILTGECLWAVRIPYLYTGSQQEKAISLNAFPNRLCGIMPFFYAYVVKTYMVTHETMSHFTLRSDYE